MSKVKNSTYIIRKYRIEDLDKLVQFRSEVERLGQIFSCTSLQDFVENLGLPNHIPEDNMFIAERAEKIIGYVDVMPELNIGRAVLSYLVHPKYDRMDLFHNLIECALHRSKELELDIAHVNFPYENGRAKRLFSKMSFHFVRQFLELKLDLSKAHLPNISRITFPLRRLRRGEEEKLTQLQNRSFANTWGYSPNTTHDLVYRSSLPHCSLEDIILAFEMDKPIGYCWTKINLEEGKAIRKCEGRIYMLGVDPDHRGKGIGKQVLLAGLSHLKSKGIRTVELTVDSVNKTACSLYKSVGFEAHTSSLWYEKAID